MTVSGVGGGAAQRERIGAVRDRVAAACARAGRDVGSVMLVAVSKIRSIEEIRGAAGEGLSHFGENRVQEAAAKVEAGLPDGSVLHLVGHLQRNKVKTACRIFRWIHSVDSADLLRRIDAAAERAIEVLVQVKLSDEETKSGVAADRLGSILAIAPELERVHLRGLMLLPPYESDPGRARRYFADLVELRERHGGPALLPHLSMGMSHDFEVAIEEGATMIRVGQAIFGPREAA